MKCPPRITGYICIELQFILQAMLTSASHEGINASKPPFILACFQCMSLGDWRTLSTNVYSRLLQDAGLPDQSSGEPENAKGICTICASPFGVPSMQANCGARRLLEMVLSVSYDVFFPHKECVGRIYQLEQILL